MSKFENAQEKKVRTILLEEIESFRTRDIFGKYIYNTPAESLQVKATAERIMLRIRPYLTSKQSEEDKMALKIGKIVLETIVVDCPYFNDCFETAVSNGYLNDMR